MSDFDAIPRHADASAVASNVQSEQELQQKAIDGARDRQAQLRRALAEMGQSAPSVQLGALIISYQTAQPSEVSFAADMITALYLRSGLDIRRRLKLAVTAVIREHARAALSQALSLRFGALVMSAVPPLSLET